jgi:hypothetical protein
VSVCVSGKSGIDSAVKRSACGRTHCRLFQHVRAAMNTLRVPACELLALTETQCSSAVERICIAVEHRCNSLPHFRCANERTVLRSSAPLLPASTYQKAVCFVFKFLLIQLIARLILIVLSACFEYFACCV